MGKGIQAEIGQNKPFDSREEQAFVALQRTADRWQRNLAEVLRPFDLSPTQYNALRILRGAGESGLPCSVIGERMINHDPDITRLMNRLERRGWVQRRRDSRDRRVITTHITKAGLELLERLQQTTKVFLSKGLGRMGESKLRSLIRFLDSARELAG